MRIVQTFRCTFGWNQPPLKYICSRGEGWHQNSELKIFLLISESMVIYEYHIGNSAKAVLMKWIFET